MCADWLVGQRFFKENTKWRGEDSHSTESVMSVSVYEGYSDPLKVPEEAGARLSTPAKAAI